MPSGAQNRFVASRIGVFEDSRVGPVGLEFSQGLIGNRDFVFRGAFKSMEAESRFPPMNIVVLENAVVSTASPFPGSVVDDDYFAGGWMNKAQGYIALEFLYQVVVSEKLASGTDLNGVSG
jgi:hypothetical protein